MRIKNRTTPVVLLALAFMTADQRYVAVPGLACVVMVLWLWMTLWDRHVISNNSTFIAVTATSCA